MATGTEGIDELFSQRELQAFLADRDNPEPLYYRLYKLFKRRILDGTVSRGRRMPTEKLLASVFGVSRITAKRSMDKLAEENLVRRYRGRGTFVEYQYHPEPVATPLLGMLERLEAMAQQTQVRVLDIARLEPPREVAEEFGLPLGEKVWRLTRIRSADGMIFAYYLSWTPGEMRGFTRGQLENRSRLNIMRDDGIVFDRIEQFLSAEAADHEIAAELGMNEGDPLLTLYRKGNDAEGRLRDILKCHYNPQRFSYLMTISAEDYRGGV